LQDGAEAAGGEAMMILCFGVSNAFENLGVLTDFPFGHYVYTDAMDPSCSSCRCSSAAYFGAGYTSWVLVSILLGDIDRRADRLSPETAAIVSLFTMVVVAVTCLLILVRREPGGASG
jgi:uncharacterized membrane protein